MLKNFLYIKTYLGTLLPYPSDGIIAENEIDKDKFTAIYKSIPYDELESKQYGNREIFYLEY